MSSIVIDTQKKGRLAVKKDRMTGDINIEAIYSLDSSETEKTVYDYNIDSGSLMSIVDCIVDGRDCTDLIMDHCNKTPDIKLYADAPYSDPIGSSFSNLEKFIFENENITAFYAPSLGSLKRGYDAGMRNFKIYMPEKDKDNPKEKAYVSKIRLRMIDLFHTNPKYEIIYCNFRDLPEEFYYFGSSGWKLHNSGLKGCGLEFNPAVAKCLDVSLLNIIEFDDYYSVEYAKNVDSQTFKYWKIPDIIRQHGHDYMQSNGKHADLYSSVFNVLTTNFRANSSSTVQTHDKIFACCPDRMVTCPGFTQTPYLFEGIRWTLDICTHNNAIDVFSPAVELSSRKKIISHFNGNRICEFIDVYRVSSSIARKYLLFQSENGGALRYKSNDLGFPSVWCVDASGPYLRAYPNAIKIGRIWWNGDKRVPFNDNYDDRLRVRFSDQEYFLSGNTTLVYFVDPGGQLFHTSEPPKLLLDKSFVSVANGQRSRNRPSIQGELVALYTDFTVYKYPNPVVARSDFKSWAPGTYYLGDLSMGYRLLAPANKYGTLTPTSSINLYSGNMSYDALHVPKRDVSGYHVYGSDYCVEYDEFAENDDYDTYCEYIEQHM
jgi:hypothetical protein